MRSAVHLKFKRFRNITVILDRSFVVVVAAAEFVLLSPTQVYNQENNSFLYPIPTTARLFLLRSKK